MGGTMASLRGFIESKGGNVICMTALASEDGTHAQISLDTDTLRALSMSFQGRLAEEVKGEIGYEIQCLTYQEGKFLLRCKTYDAFRAGINGARDS